MNPIGSIALQFSQDTVSNQNLSVIVDGQDVGTLHDVVQDALAYRAAKPPPGPHPDAAAIQEKVLHSNRWSPKVKAAIECYLPEVAQTGWTVDHQQRVLEPHPVLHLHWGALVACGAIPKYPMREWVFEYKDLRGTDFSGADLRRADFSTANLHLANFEGANLEGARFSDDCVIEGAKFRRANLSGVSFRGTNVMFADLWNWEVDPNTGMVRRPKGRK